MDINEQPDEEIHRSWSGRVINTGASVPDLGCATLWARGCILVSSEQKLSELRPFGFYGGFITKA